MEGPKPESIVEREVRTDSLLAFVIKPCVLTYLTTLVQHKRNYN